MKLILKNIEAFSRGVKVALFLTFLTTFAGCSWHEEISHADCIVPLRISAVVKGEADSNNLIPETKGTLEDISSSEGNESGSANERFIGKLRVLAFDKDTKILKINRLFTHDAPNVADRFVVDGSGVISADLQLYSSTYIFRIIANEKAEWILGDLLVGTTTLANLESRSTIQSIAIKNSDNTVVAESDLASSVASPNYLGLPMIAKRDLYVPYDPNATIVNPMELSSMLLERTVAKVEVSLTNQDANNGNAVYATAATYSIKSVAIKNVNQTYNLLEESLAPVTAGAVTLSKNITHSAGAPFPNQKILGAYIAERTNATLPTATIVEIKVDKAGVESTYEIPLYQMEGAIKNYKIYRNTIYKINAILTGSEGTEVSFRVSVSPWTPVNVPTVVPKGDHLMVAETNAQMVNVPSYSIEYISSVAPNTITNLQAFYRYRNAAGAEITQNCSGADIPTVSIAQTVYGNISINSAIPTNKLVKTITFTVSNGIGLTENIKVQQLPPLFITNQQGVESNRRTSLSGGLTNASMYLMRTMVPDPTKTYGYPPLDANGYTASTPDVANIISPTLMCASQFGASGVNTIDAVRSMCAEYWEKTMVNGVPKIYDDWRLPTRAEFIFIDQLQQAGGSIQGIMTGGYYWTASGAQQTISGNTGDGSSLTSAYTRCVRDVKDPQELREIMGN